jgi:glycine/D-amino acid oxidase-like deaminating enzyme
MLSYWEREYLLPPADIVIIGCGIVGLSAAVQLKQQNPAARVLIVERGFLPSGASTKNAGFACYGSSSELLDDLAAGHSPDEVFDLVELRFKGLQRLRAKLGDDGIGYKHTGSYEIFTTPEEFKTNLDALPALNQQLASITGLTETYSTNIPDRLQQHFQSATGLVFNQGEGQIDTGKMVSSWLKLAQETGVDIKFGCPVQHLEQDNSSWRVYLSDDFYIAAQQVLVATNGFAQQLLPELEVQPARNQVLITKPIPKLPFEACFHYQQGYYYFRNVGNRVLFGGGRNLDKAGESTSDFGHTALIQDTLVQMLHELVLPGYQAEVDYWWSGILGIGARKRPIIQAVKPGLYCAVRLGGMGVAIGTLVGETVAEMMIDK